jgi:hypothetical protein
MPNITCKVCNDSTTKLCDDCSKKQNPSNNLTTNDVVVISLPHGVNSRILHLQAGLPGLTYSSYLN